MKSPVIDANLCLHRWKKPESEELELEDELEEGGGLLAIAGSGRVDGLWKSKQ